MATGAEVLSMLIPTGGWVIFGDDYDGIQFLECEPITKTQFKAGFSKVDAWIAEQQASNTAARASAHAKLAELGLTPDEIAALVGA